MDENPYIVYVKLDEQNRIVDINSSAFLTDLTGWVEIDAGFENKHHHAQGNYFPDNLMDERGVYRYLYTPDAAPYWRERTQAEMDADYTEPEARPTLETRVETVESKTGELEEALEMILSGVTADE